MKTQFRTLLIWGVLLVTHTAVMAQSAPPPPPAGAPPGFPIQGIVLLWMGALFLGIKFFKRKS